MTRDAVTELTDRWMNDAAFRDAVRKDPVGAIKATGLDLDESELTALRDVDWSIGDEELRARISKSGLPCQC